MARSARRLVVIWVTLAMALAACRAQPPAPAAEPPGREPSAGAWRTWVLPSPTEVTVPPPPAPGSAENRAEEQELRDFEPRRTPAIADVVGKWDGRGEPVSGPWIRMAMDFVAGRPDDPPAAARAYALVAVAAYDAMVAAWHYKYEYRRDAPNIVLQTSLAGPDFSYPSEHAAIAGAASRVLAYLFPDRPATRLDEAAVEAAESRLWSGANWRSDATAGLDLGRQVAERVIAHARSDGSDLPCEKAAPGGRPEFWAPPDGSAAGAVQPCAGDWKPWVLAAGSELRTVPPAPFGSEAFAVQADELVNVQVGLTAEQQRLVEYWAAGDGTPGPTGIWNEIAVAFLRKRQPSEPQAERAMALLNVAMADAGVAAWDTKYTYWDPRPENGVPDVGAVPDWKPYLLSTPASPSYVSSHAAYAGAFHHVLSWLFPENDGFFNAKAEEAADAMVWGGIDWAAARSEGIGMGRKVGTLVIERARSDGAPPVPPPAKR